MLLCLIMKNAYECILSTLLADLPGAIQPEDLEARITGIASDSRRVEPGCLFVAVRGSSFDGHRYIRDAVARGAAAVVGVDGGISLPVPYIQVPDSRMAIPYLAAAFYGHPGRKLTMIGVTGTDGKTTTCNLIYHILQAAGYRAGMISTVNAVIGDQVLDTGFHVTTPEAVDVQRYLAMMVEAGLTHAVLETTSHGWAQHRVDACEFDLAVITNITHEHLDEHGSYENYRNAKARLFLSLAETQPKPLGNLRVAVLNRDDASYPFLQEICSSVPGVSTLTYGAENGAAFSAEQVQYSPAGMSFRVRHSDKATLVTTSLVGSYNVANILAAYTATVGGLGIKPEAAQQGIQRLEGIPGRMERIDLGQDFYAFVDFAHTPNALRRTLETARQMTAGRLIVVFGSAGLRDRQKRRLMAQTAITLADLTIFTAEDPRTEALDDILAEMADGAKDQGGKESINFWRIADRGEALRKALAFARAGDVVLACGKGHEQSMCFGTIEYPWDDRTALRAALAEYLGVPGPQMPYIPTQG